MKLSSLAPLLLAASLAACDSNGTDPDDLSYGRFDGRITGDVSISIDGEAYSYNTPNFGQDEVVMVDNSEGVLLDVYHVTDDFVEGTSSVNDWAGGEGGVLGVLYVQDLDRYFASTDGTIRITEIDDDGVTGEVDFTAIEIDPETDEPLFDEIRVVAAFRARYDGSSAGTTRIREIRSTVHRNR
jgi:hypothetical protein